MALSVMVAADEDMLICDFAETYHVLNWRGLPADLAAVLAFGLRENSRIKMKLSGMKLPMDTMLSAVAADALNLLVWFQTKDAAKKRNRPGSILNILMGVADATPGPDIQAFDTVEEFERRRKEILEGV